MHNLGNRVALIFSSLDFSIPQVPCSGLRIWHSLDACDCVDCSGLTGLIGCWGDALSLSKFLSSPDLSGSLFMGFGFKTSPCRKLLRITQDKRVFNISHFLPHLKSLTSNLLVTKQESLTIKEYVNSDYKKFAPATELCG